MLYDWIKLIFSLDFIELVDYCPIKAKHILAYFAASLKQQAKSLKMLEAQMCMSQNRWIAIKNDLQWIKPALNETTNNLDRRWKQISFNLTHIKGELASKSEVTDGRLQKNMATFYHIYVNRSTWVRILFIPMPVPWMKWSTGFVLRCDTSEFLNI